MKRVPLAALAFTAVLAAVPAQAQTMEDKWTFQAIIYGYLPDIGGSTSFPAGGTGSSINVNADQLLSSLNFAFMGTLEARKGRWGAFTDILYLNVSGDKNGSREFSLTGLDIPAGVSSNLDYKLKGALWTIAGEYAVIADASMLLYVVGGARLFDIQQSLSYALTADVGPFKGPTRTGQASVDLSYWDAIVGVKGRYLFGDRREWFVPYYADVGTGQSQLTWQVFGGIGYQFNNWGSVLAGWRYIDYNFKSSSKVDSLDFNGPMIGVAFNW